MPTEAVTQAMAILRSPANFKWHVIPMLVFVLYAYANEVEQANWSRILAGLAFFLTDVLWEILNALILHGTGVSSLWVVSGGTAFLIFVGLGIEISLMFAIGGLMTTKCLLKDRHAKILGIPNRWFFIGAFSLLGAIVESFLIQTPFFHWGYSWWNFPLVALIGYAPFEYICFTTYDAKRHTQIAIVTTLMTLDLVLIAVFGFGLHWI